ncbi:protein disulfide-isomerase A4-like [Glandiceps talaboti]
MAVNMKWKKLLVVLFAGLFLFALVTKAEEEPIDDDDEEESCEGDIDDDDDDDIDDDDGGDEVTVEEEDDVLVLTETNFDDVVDSKDIILVEFYAPWCGHCKKLAPEYSRAAKQLKENDPPVSLAKLDATEHGTVASRYDVSGYPTMKIFRHGEVFDYKGPREEEGIVKYMKEQADPNWKPPPEAVLTLTDDNFDEIVDKEELILVEFYAPWCGHCKKLAPEFESAAQVLKGNDPPIPLGKVDATVETKVAARFGVKGYPTLKIFRKGKDYEYSGPREEMGIINYMMTQSGDSSKVKADKKALKEFLSDEQDVTIAGFFESEDDKLYQTYLDAGNNLRDDFKFGHTFDKDSMDHYKVKPGSVVVFVPERFHSKYEPKRHVFNKASGTVTELQDFYNKNQVPLVGHRTSRNEKKRYTNKPLVVVYYTVDFSFDHRKATQIWRNKVVEVAKDFKDITFAISDEDDFSKELDELGLADSGEEINVAVFAQDGRKYKMEPEEDFDGEVLHEFVQKFEDGDLDPVIKSQPVPKKNDGPVKIVVGKTFDKIVLDKSKDVLIEFYAPWCGHCKNLEPIYKKLGKKFKKAKNVVIAKMDATANDVPPNYSVNGFPTIYFAPANNKDSPLKFDGARDLDGFSKFIEEKATVSLKSGKDEL